MSDTIVIDAVVAESSVSAIELGESVGGAGTVAGYGFLIDKPQINGVTLVGDKSTSDIGITNFVGGQPLQANNKNGLVPTPPAISEMGQWHLLSDTGWIEMYPQTDSKLPWIIVNAAYPVGSIFETTSVAFDPNEEFGGTWQMLNGLITSGNASLVTDDGDEIFAQLDNGLTTTYKWIRK